MYTVRICTASGCDVVQQPVLDVNAIRPSDPLSPITDFTILESPDPGDSLGTQASSTLQTLHIEDEFFGGDLLPGNVGELGWVTNNLTLFPTVAQANHPGVIGGFVIGGVASIFLSPVNSFPMRPSWFFDATFVVFPLVSNSVVGVKIGLVNNPAILSTDGIFFEKDLNDMNYFAVTKSAGTSTRVDMGVSALPGWSSFRIRRINSSAIGFSINGGAEALLNTNVPKNSPAKPAIMLDGRGQAQGIIFDYFGCRIHGVQR